GYKPNITSAHGYSLKVEEISACLGKLNERADRIDAQRLDKPVITHFWRDQILRVRRRERENGGTRARDDRGHTLRAQNFYQIRRLRHRRRTVILMKPVFGGGEQQPRDRKSVV